jgi:D-amino-acid oxidase
VPRRFVVVIGAGVSGLSCAHELLVAGHEVELWSAAPPLETTSAVAAALWHPFMVGPAEAVARWAARTKERLTALATIAASGVTGRRAIEHTHAGPLEFETFVVEMPIYLEFLVTRVNELGGRFVTRRVGALDEVTAFADVAVNTSGLGARALANDPRVFGVAGQIVRVDGVALDHVVLDERDLPTYVVPRSKDTIFGGSATPIADGFEPRVDPLLRDDILTRCARLLGSARDVHVLADRVGVRPCRDEVRLEREGRVVHDYGHGGAGVTLSWGCAEEVVLLVEEALAAG